MYDLYIANKNYSSWSLRPWLLMRMLEIPFEERLVPFGGGSNYETFRHFSPTGKVPCLIAHDAVVWESLGIVEYLAERHAGVWPVEPKARIWARCAAAEMHAGFGTLRDLCSMNCSVRMRLNDISGLLQRDIARLNELWNEGLVKFGGPFLAGPAFSAVDAFFAPVAFRVQTYGLPLDGVNMSYVSRLLALPPMRRWYEDALAEPWRDQDHEAEIRRAAILLTDLRTNFSP